MRAQRWTVADLDRIPDDGKRREIIGGELFVSTQPDWFHQIAGGRVFSELDQWNRLTMAGFASPAPGIIFAADNAVAPDVVWISRARFEGAIDAGGHLLVAPELIVEVLSPGTTNERRDREAKLKLYSSRGVGEYWIVDWRRREIEVYRREELGLRLVGTLFEGDALTSPLLPGFRLPLEQLFAGIPLK
jgi:Uma2 family endonuclease